MSPTASPPDASPLALDATLAASPPPAAETSSTRGALVAKTSTVLPRAEPTTGEQTGAPADDNRPRYVASRLLGEGAMGEVVLARDHDIERQVAIKRLRPEHAHDTGLFRFADEIRTVGGLEHPAIVPIYDVGVDADGKHYFVMKYIEGETLEEIIRRLAARDEATLRRFTFDDRLRIFLQVARAIAYAHARGILHRDIKPANIMVGPFGEVTVTDWGIAKRIHDPVDPSVVHAAPAESPAFSMDRRRMVRREQRVLDAADRTKAARTHETQAGAILGTPMYMSPEQLRGDLDAVDERSDVYSLVAVFYELMTTRPYVGNVASLFDLMNAVVYEFPVERFEQELSAVGAPHEYYWVIVRGLAKTPSERYASAQELIDDLERTMRGDICVRCVYTLGKRAAHGFVHWEDRHPRAFVALLAAVAASVVTAFGLGVYEIVRHVAA